MRSKNEMGKEQILQYHMTFYVADWSVFVFEGSDGISGLNVKTTKDKEANFHERRQ